MPPENYIGDGVYARYDGFGVWCYTDRETRHEIYFEPAVLAALNRFYHEHTAPKKPAKQKDADR